jgi:predicted RecA/RadA family phage recombinase
MMAAITLNSDLSTILMVNAVDKGVTLAAVAGEALLMGDVVRFVPSGAGMGRVVKADATDAAKGRAIGIARTAAASGQAVAVILEGTVDGYVLDDLDYGATVYLSDTTGTPADTAGTTSVKLGYVVAKQSTKIGADPDKLFHLQMPAL